MNRQVILNDAKQTDYYAVQEAIKTIRANLLFCSADKKAILLTSCHANEGKTTVTVEVAKSMTEIGKKVLVIDTDLRKSVLLQYSTVTGTVKGLSQYLSGQASLEEVLYPTQFDLLHIIYAGQLPPNPSELVASERMKNLIEQMKEQYDYIFIDTPPVGLVIDAAMLAPYCDGVVLVISMKEIGYKEVIAAKEQLQKSGCHIIGTVLNEVKSHRIKKRFWEKKQTYNYYHSSKQK